MCNICGRLFRCSGACPNAPEPKPIHRCFQCRKGIYAGEEVYKLDEKLYCEDCVFSANFIAGEE